MSHKSTERLVNNSTYISFNRVIRGVVLVRLPAGIYALGGFYTYSLFQHQRDVDFSSNKELKGAHAISGLVLMNGYYLSCYTAHLGIS